MAAGVTNGDEATEAKPWSSRFERPIDQLAAEFNASISFDQRLSE